MKNIFNLSKCLKFWLLLFGLSSLQGSAEAFLKKSEKKKSKTIALKNKKKLHQPQKKRKKRKSQKKKQGKKTKLKNKPLTNWGTTGMSALGGGSLLSLIVIHQMKKKGTPKKIAKNLKVSTQDKTQMKPPPTAFQVISSLHKKKLFDIPYLLAHKKLLPWQLDKESMETWKEKFAQRWKTISLLEQREWEEVCIINGWWEASKRGKAPAKNFMALFAEKYIQALQTYFVTWAQFGRQIQKVGQEASQKIATHAPKNLYILLPRDSTYHHLWTCLLFWDYIGKAIPNGTKLHFITPPTNPQNQQESITQTLLRYDPKSTYKASTSLVYICSGALYQGEKMYQQLAAFNKAGYPPHLYWLTPYITDQAQRKITGMDQAAGYLYPRQEDAKLYLHGQLTTRSGYAQESFYAKASLQFMPSTKVIPSIYLPLLKLGTHTYFTSPLLLPYMLPPHHAILYGVVCYGLTYKKAWTAKEIEAFTPKSFFAFNGHPHHYTLSEQKAIKVRLWQQADDSDDELFLPKEEWRIHKAQKEKNYYPSYFGKLPPHCDPLPYHTFPWYEAH